MYVEDYLGILAGNVCCEHCGSYGFVNLANYDYSPIRSMTTVVANGNGLTDKQRELALRIVLKYKKQFAKHSINIDHLNDNPQWRSPLRHVDRTKRVSIDDQFINIKFPFKPELVDFFRKYSKNNRGPISGIIEWHSEEKVWKLSATEYNIVVVDQVTKNQNFDYSVEFQTAVNNISKILKNKKDHAIYCDLQDGVVILKNACSDLVECFDSQSTGNILHDIGLVKKLGVNNYTLSVCRYLYKANPLLLKLVAKRCIYFEKSTSIQKIAKQLELLGLLPMGDNGKDIKTAFFRETIYGLNAKYVEQRASLVLYCTHYTPFGVDDPYFLKGY